MVGEYFCMRKGPSPVHLWLLVVVEWIFIFLQLLWPQSIEKMGKKNGEGIKSNKRDSTANVKLPLMNVNKLLLFVVRKCIRWRSTRWLSFRIVIWARGAYFKRSDFDLSLVINEIETRGGLFGRLNAVSCRKKKISIFCFECRNL